MIDLLPLTSPAPAVVAAPTSLAGAGDGATSVAPGATMPSFGATLGQLLDTRDPATDRSPPPVLFPAPSPALPGAGQEFAAYGKKVPAAPSDDEGGAERASEPDTRPDIAPAWFPGMVAAPPVAAPSPLPATASLADTTRSVAPFAEAITGTQAAGPNPTSDVPAEPALRTRANGRFAASAPHPSTPTATRRADRRADAHDRDPATDPALTASSTTGADGGRQIGIPAPVDISPRPGLAAPVAAPASVTTGAGSVAVSAPVRAARSRVVAPAEAGAAAFVLPTQLLPQPGVSAPLPGATLDPMPPVVPAILQAATLPSDLTRTATPAASGVTRQAAADTAQTVGTMQAPLLPSDPIATVAGAIRRAIVTAPPVSTPDTPPALAAQPAAPLQGATASVLVPVVATPSTPDITPDAAIDRAGTTVPTTPDDGIRAATPPISTAASIAAAQPRPAITVSSIPQPAGRVFAAAFATATAWRERAGHPPARDITDVPAIATAPATLHDRAIIDATTGAQGAPLDLTRDTGLQQMIDRIESLRDDADANDTRVRLTPDTLGSVDIAVRQEGDRVHVRFTAEQEATRALIADAQPRLVDAAAARGTAACPQRALRRGRRSRHHRSTTRLTKEDSHE